MATLSIGLITGKPILLSTDFQSKTASTSEITGGTGTTNLLTQANSGSYIEFTSTGNTTLICPSGLTAGFNCTLVNLGGGITITAGAGVVVRDLLGSYLIEQKYEIGHLYFSSTNEWILTHSVAT